VRLRSQAAADELAASFAALPLDERPLLPDDVWGLIVGVLLSVLEPCPVVRLSGTCKTLRALLPPPTRQQLRTDHEKATALCLKIGLQSGKELREATGVRLHHRNLTSDDLASLAALSLDLPVLDWLILHELIQNNYQQPDIVGKFLRLVEGLHEGALRALTMLCIEGVHVGNTGAFELADALDRGAMPQLKGLGLVQAAISGATLAILTPALRRGGGPLWSASTSSATRSPLMALRPSWLPPSLGISDDQMRRPRRRRGRGLRGSTRSTFRAGTPSPAPATTSSWPRSRVARCPRS
jgi:hypothetical protein